MLFSKPNWILKLVNFCLLFFLVVEVLYWGYYTMIEVSYWLEIKTKQGVGRMKIRCQGEILKKETYTNMKDKFKKRYTLPIHTHHHPKEKEFLLI